MADKPRRLSLEEVATKFEDVGDKIAFTHVEDGREDIRDVDVKVNLPEYGT